MDYAYTVYSIDEDSGTAYDVEDTDQFPVAYEAWCREVNKMKLMANHPSFTSVVTVYLYEPTNGNMLAEETILPAMLD